MNRIRLVWMMLSYVNSLMWVAIAVRHGGGYWTAAICTCVSTAAVMLAGHFGRRG